MTDTLAPRGLTRIRIQRAARDFLVRLLETNASRVENDLAERVRESRRRFEADLRRAVAEGERNAVRALERARAAHASGAETVHGELVRLGRIIESLKALADESERSTQQRMERHKDVRVDDEP